MADRSWRAGDGPPCGCPGLVTEDTARIVDAVQRRVESGEPPWNPLKFPRDPFAFARIQAHGAASRWLHAMGFSIVTAPEYEGDPWMVRSRSSPMRSPGRYPSRSHPGHPRRAVGQVRLGGDGQGLRGLGRPAGERLLRYDVPRRARARHRGLRAARRRQLLPVARGRHPLQLSRQRPLATGRDLSRRSPRRPHRGRPVADPAGRRGHLGQGPGQPRAGRRRPHGAATHPDPRQSRTAGPRPAPRLPPRSAGRPRRARRQ